MRRTWVHEDAGQVRQPCSQGVGAQTGFLRVGAYGNETPGRIPKNLLRTGHSCAHQRCVRKLARKADLPMHGAAMQLALSLFLVQYLSRPGDLVVDLFGGTMTTAKARQPHQPVRLAGECVKSRVNLGVASSKLSKTVHAHVSLFLAPPRCSCQTWAFRHDEHGILARLRGGARSASFHRRIGRERSVGLTHLFRLFRRGAQGRGRGHNPAGIAASRKAGSSTCGCSSTPDKLQSTNSWTMRRWPAWKAAE